MLWAMETTQQAHRNVAGEVRASLARANLSGRQAAARLGWKQQYISRRLNGDVPFNVNELYALSHLLRVKITQFFPEDHGINALYLGAAVAA